VIGVLSDALMPSLGRDSLRIAMAWTLPVCLVTAACHARVAAPDGRTETRVAERSAARAAFD
jgi:hypothetical protein